jgi:lipopolysaccharide biosynthesis glycosyltransferase
MSLDTAGKLDHHAYLIGDVSDVLLSAFPEGAQVHRLLDYPRSFRFQQTTHVPTAAMLRIFALEDLAPLYRRVIYLDGDIFQAWGSIADLCDLPDTGKPLAAVRDRSHWFDDPRLREQKTYVAALHPAIGERYFNSGMLAVNGPVWAREGYSAAALDFLAQHYERCRYGDQSALNAVIAGNWDSLCPGWNWQMSKTSFPLLNGRKPRLTHFTGPTKPWNDSLRLFDPAPFFAMKAYLASRNLLHLLDKRKSPDSFTLDRERQRMRALEPLADGALAKRDLIKVFLTAPDHLDIACGIPAYDVDPGST